MSKKFGLKHCNNYKLSQFYGTKSGFRKFARLAKLPFTEGYENLKTPKEVIEALRKIFEKGFLRAVVKVDDGISGYGNLIIKSSDFPQIKLLRAGEFFDEYLKKIRWDVVGSGVVEGWVEGVVHTSSILILVEKGKSKIICFQDQLLVDGDKWAGCYFPSSLGKKVDIMKKINLIVKKSSSFLIKKGFWGYYSFDLITTKNNEVYCVEANMRKIGSFYPRVFVDAIIKNFDLRQRVAYVSSDYINPQVWKGKSFIEVKNKLEKLLWPINNSKEGVLIFNTGAIKEGGRFDFVAVASTLDRAKAIRKEVIRLAA